ncbi:MAG: YebC/PmpR family DNA-binding transcriptional regulator, partial [Desulfobulbaceae bacterium]|nr:YebC/PmpR family DNA-binding transcriptional regulator [Desulfobulbaceae bacterium]
NLGESGCVSWMFDKKGSLLVDKSAVSEDKLLDVVLDAGAEDVVEEENEFQVITLPDDFATVLDVLESESIPLIESSISMIPKNVVEITDEKVAKQVLTLLEKLEDHEDVQNVHANFDIPDEIMEGM